MKYIEFLPPIHVNITYPQAVILWDDPQGNIIDTTTGATAPNPFIPGNTDEPNLSEYPIVRPGTYLGTFRGDGHHNRPCIKFHGKDGEEDGAVPILQNKNPRHPNQGPWAYGIRIHEGYTASWRGSAGCMTLESPGGDEFLKENFEEGELVAIFIPDQEWFAEGGSHV